MIRPCRLYSCAGGEHGCRAGAASIIPKRAENAYSHSPFYTVHAGALTLTPFPSTWYTSYRPAPTESTSTRLTRWPAERVPCPRHRDALRLAGPCLAPTSPVDAGSQVEVEVEVAEAAAEAAVGTPTTAWNRYRRCQDGMSPLQSSRPPLPRRTARPWSAPMPEATGSIACATCRLRLGPQAPASSARPAPVRPRNDPLPRA